MPNYDNHCTPCWLVISGLGLLHCIVRCVQCMHGEPCSVWFCVCSFCPDCCRLRLFWLALLLVTSGLLLEWYGEAFLFSISLVIIQLGPPPPRQQRSLAI